MGPLSAGDGRLHRSILENDEPPGTHVQRLDQTLDDNGSPCTREPDARHALECARTTGQPLRAAQLRPNPTHQRPAAGRSPYDRQPVSAVATEIESGKTRQATHASRCSVSSKL